MSSLANNSRQDLKDYHLKALLLTKNFQQNEQLPTEMKEYLNSKTLRRKHFELVTMELKNNGHLSLTNYVERIIIFALRLFSNKSCCTNTEAKRLIEIIYSIFSALSSQTDDQKIDIYSSMHKLSQVVDPFLIVCIYLRVLKDYLNLYDTKILTIVWRMHIGLQHVKINRVNIQLSTQIDFC